MTHCSPPKDEILIKFEHERCVENEEGEEMREKEGFHKLKEEEEDENLMLIESKITKETE